MDPHLPSHELRILVIHNQDTLSTIQDSDAQDEEARADILQVAQEVTKALTSRGHFVSVQGVDIPTLPALIQSLQEDRPDLVFNLCESMAGDDRNEVVLPTLLDLLQIPYTGSDAWSLGLALHKDRTQEVLRRAGVPTPKFAWLGGGPNAHSDDLNWIRYHGLEYPLIVKPTRENASVGIRSSSLVHNDDALLQQIRWIRDVFNQPMLIEEYIAGREIHVSLLGNNPPLVLPLHEIDFSALPPEHPHVYTYESKWNMDSLSCQLIDAVPLKNLSFEIQSRIQAVALQTFAALELRDYARCDIRLSPQGEPYVIDVNPNCVLASANNFTRAAKNVGYTYEELIETIAHHALLRSSHDARRPPAVFDSFRSTPRQTAASSAGTTSGRILSERNLLRV